MDSNSPRRFVGRDMNWPGVIVALLLLGLLIGDFATLGSGAAGFVGAAVIVVVGAVSLRTTAHRRRSGHA